MLARTLFIGIVSLVLLPYLALAADRESLGGSAERVPLFPQQTIIITGHQQEGRFITKIEPFNEFRLNRFTRVFWENNSEVSVRIKLGAGKDCREASNAELRAMVAPFNGCFITKTPVPAGGVLQTNFNEQGRYPYEVEYMTEKAIEKGVITVY